MTPKRFLWKQANRTDDVDLYLWRIKVLEAEEPEIKWDDARGAEVSITERDRQHGLICLGDERN